MKIEFLCIIFACVIFSCKNKYATYDNNGQGTNMTPFGYLVHDKWYYNMGNDALFLNGKEISSQVYNVLPNQYDLIFKLGEKGKVLYKKSDTDNWHTGRSWFVDFKDSLIHVDFGDSLIKNLDGKIIMLGFSQMTILSKNLIDNSEDNTKNQKERRITIMYSHNKMESLSH